VICHKENIQYTVVKENELPENRHTYKLIDESIELKNNSSKDKYSNKLKRVVVWDDINNQTIELITNQMTWTALITILILKAIAKFSWHLSNLVAFIRLNLFVKINLQQWLDKPFEDNFGSVEIQIQEVLF